MAGCSHGETATCGSKFNIGLVLQTYALLLSPYVSHSSQAHPFVLTSTSNASTSQQHCDYEDLKFITVYPKSTSAGHITFNNDTSNTISAACDGKLFGSGDMVCKSDGTWSPGSIVCFGSVQCPAIDPPRNGHIIGAKLSYAIFDLIEFQCEETYHVIGPSRAYCRPNGQWSERPPKCRSSTPLQCVQPDVASSVTFQPRRELYVHGSVVAFSCQNERGLVPAQGDQNNDGTSTCIDGEWHPDPAECYEISNGQIVTPPENCVRRFLGAHVIAKPDQISYEPSKAVVFSCEAGYHLSGHEVSTCMGRGGWDTVLPECTVTPSSCRHPNVNSNYDVIPDLRKYKDKVTVVLLCGRDAFTATCENGTWDHIPPMCIGAPDGESDGPDINDDIAIIVKEPVTNQSVARQLDQLANTTRRADRLTSQSIDSIVGFLEEIKDLRTPNQEATDGLIETIGNLAGASEAALQESQRAANATNRALHTLARQLDIVDTSVTNGVYTASYPNIDVMVLDLELLQLSEGITYATHDDNLTDVYFNMSAVSDVLDMDRINASVTLPGVLLGAIRTESNRIDSNRTDSRHTELRLSFTVHKRASLFVSLSLEELNEAMANGWRRARFQRKPSAPVIYVNVRHKGGNVQSEPAITSFPINEANGKRKNPQCVHWDFLANSQRGDWSTEGCKPVRSIRKKGIFVCQCRRLANFNILLDVYDDNSLPIEIQYFTHILTYVGCSFSACGLLLTIIAYASSQKLRSKQPNQILLCLMTTLLMLNVTILVSMVIADHLTGWSMPVMPCTIQGALLHFFALASLCWMGVEGMNVYLLLVRIINAYIPRFVRRAAIFAWGVPGLVVVVLIGVFRKDYVQLETCFLNIWPHIIGILIPVGLLLIFNTVIFIAVVKSIGMTRAGSSTSTYRGAAGADSEMTARHRHRIWRLRSAFFVMLLLGLTWVFGFFGNIPNLAASSVFQVLFSLLNAFQGFLIFVIYCVRQPPARKQLSDRISSCFAFFPAAARRGSTMTSGSTSGSTSQDQNRNEPIATSAECVVVTRVKHVSTKVTSKSVKMF